MEAITESGVNYHIVTCPFHFADSEKIVEGFLKEHKEIDGIFASSDVSAAGALKAAVTLGIQVPAELQIVGFDGIAMGEMLSPGLTTIAQDVYKMGAIATRVLIKRIENQEIEQHFYEVPVQLKLRGTTRSVEK
jgi:LacI family transcriptional regulator